MGALTLTPNLATWGIAGARHARRDHAAVLLAGGDLGRARRRRCLVLFGLLPMARTPSTASPKGTDVYLFLIGMMLLAEVARKEGLFDWLAPGRRAAGQGLGDAAVHARSISSAPS